jgi:hypothetical protein
MVEVWGHRWMMLVCTYEDRLPDLIGVKLLVSSLARHLPTVPVHVACPAPGSELETWLRGRPNVTLDMTRDESLAGWNAKAGLLLRLIDAGHREVIWIDADVIVADDFRALVPRDTSLIVTEELCRNGPKENRLRTAGWGWEVARALPHLVNSALMRVTPAHRELLSAWVGCLQTAAYREAQRLPFERRPIHMIGDQDVLGGLLGSRQFAHLPVKFLARGRDIIHDIRGGYAPAHRIANLFRSMPPLVHAQGAKPWRYPEVPRLLREPGRYYRFTQVEGSPYPYVAREHRGELAEFPAFLEVRSPLGKFLGAVTRCNPHLHALPQAIVDEGLDQIERGRGFVVRAARLVKLITARGQSS